MIHYYTIINRITGESYNTEKAIFEQSKGEEDIDYTYSTEDYLKSLVSADPEKFKGCIINCTKSEKSEE